MCGNLLNTLDPGNTHGRPSVLNGWTIHYWVFWNTHAHTHTHTYTHTRVVFLQPTRITKGNRNYLLQYFIFLGIKSTPLLLKGPRKLQKTTKPRNLSPPNRCAALASSGGTASQVFHSEAESTHFGWRFLLQSLGGIGLSRFFVWRGGEGGRESMKLLYLITLRGFFLLE